jgi:hypothetical protein
MYLNGLRAIRPVNSRATRFARVPGPHGLYGRLHSGNTAGSAKELDLP